CLKALLDSRFWIPALDFGGSGSFWILAGAIWSAPPTAALPLSAEPIARADVPSQLSVAKRAKAAALPPHSKSPTVSGPYYRTPQNEPLPTIPGCVKSHYAILYAVTFQAFS